MIPTWFWWALGGTFAISQLLDVFIGEWERRHTHAPDYHGNGSKV